MGIAKFLSKGIKVTVGEERPIRDGINRAVEDGIGRAAVGIGKGAKKAFTHDSEKALWNGYTGVRESGLAAGVAWTGAAGYLAYSGLKAKDAQVTGPISYERQAPIMGGDGMSNSNAPTLGASGSLVFGLNSMRRG